MQDIVDSIQSIARQRGRGESGPLIMLRALDGGQGERISHLPIDNDLAQAWLALLGEPFRPHQSAAVTALRRNEPVALLAANPRVTTSIYLLIYALCVTQGTSALLLAPDARAATAARARLLYINESLPALYRLPTQLIEPQVRPDPAARIVIATPETLHSRLLRHHDRAWRQLWRNLHMMTLLDLHRYSGVAGAHLADLLLRVQRVATSHSGGAIPHLLASGYELHEPLAALESLYNAPWKILSGDDLPHTPTALAVWRNTADRLREAVDVARLLQKQGYRIHILCQPLESAAITPLVGDIEDITTGTSPQSGHVLICAGHPGAQSAVRRLLRSGYQAVILILGESPLEQMLARHSETLLSQGPSNWPAAPLNAYVTAQHTLCAATELPLSATEVESAGIGQIVDRLVEGGQLIDLPDEEVAWHAGPAAGDPYGDWSVLAASGSAIMARTEQGRQIDLIDPSAYARWCYPGAALPVVRGGLRVTAQDEESNGIALRMETSPRRTFPLRRCTVTLRDQRETRALFLSSQIGYGRAVVEEEIYSSREYTSGGSASEVMIRPAQQVRWAAPCCWFELPVAPQVNGQQVGWSLAGALSAATLASFSDLVPCLDEQARRLYLVDAQPGGNGLAAWLYAHAEDMLPLAYDIALACRHDPLLEPWARADMDWLLPMLGR
ncbi:MAG: helicase, partial [Roseiflexaceae bacterium]|nr:helicase [Roseiflexaceae bacterium]